jgi:hypothetical protein
MTTTPNEPVENPAGPGTDPDIDPQPGPDQGGEAEQPDVVPSSGDAPLTADPSLGEVPETPAPG